MGKKRLAITGGAILAALGALAGVGWLVWYLVGLIPVDTVRLLFIIAALAVPLSAWVGWWFGRTEARGRLAGIDMAVDKVMGAATKAAGLGVNTARDMRRSAPAQMAPTVVLPDVRIVPRISERADVIEL